MCCDKGLEKENAGGSPGRKKISKRNDADLYFSFKVVQLYEKYK